MQKNYFILLLVVGFHTITFSMQVTKPKVLRASNFKSGITPLMKAAQEGSVEECTQHATSTELVNQKDGAGRSAFLYAAGNGKTDVCTYLLEHGADLSARDHKRRNAIVHAAAGGHAELCRSLTAMGLEITSDECSQILPEVAKKGYADACRFLLEQGAAGDFTKLIQEIRTLLVPAEAKPGKKTLIFIEGWTNHITFIKPTSEGREEVIRLLERANHN